MCVCWARLDPRGSTPALYLAMTHMSSTVECRDLTLMRDETLIVRRETPRESRGLHRGPRSGPLSLYGCHAALVGSEQGSKQGGHVEEGRHELLRDEAHEVLEALLLRRRDGAKFIPPSRVAVASVAAVSITLAWPACVPDA